MIKFLKNSSNFWLSSDENKKTPKKGNSFWFKAFKIVLLIGRAVLWILDKFSDLE